MQKNKKTDFKYPKPHRRRRRPLGFLIILLFIIVSTILFFVLKQSKSSPSSTEQSSSVSSNNSSDHQSSPSAPSSTSTDTEQQLPFNKTPVQNEGEDPNLSANLTGVINFSGVIADHLTIYTNIDQVLHQGSCQLTLKHQSHIIKRKVNVLANPSTSSCETFRIPLSELGEQKSWHATIEVFDKTRKGIIEKEISL